MKQRIAVLGLLLLPVGASTAQTVIGLSSRLDPGTRIRITDSAQGTRLEGVLLEWRGDSAVARVTSGGALVLVPPPLGSRIEVYDGMRSSSRKGAMIGGAIGMGAAVILVVAASSDPYMSVSAGQAIGAIALNTAVYAGVGALIGTAIKKPRWRALDAAPRLEALLDPRGRAGLGVRIGF